VRDLLARKLTQLEARRLELEAFSDTLRDYLQLCNRALEAPSPVECPVVENLSDVRST